MRLVTIRGSVTVETLPVDVSIPQVFEKTTRECRDKDWETGAPEQIRNYSNTHHLVESAG